MVTASELLNVNGHNRHDKTVAPIAAYPVGVNTATPSSIPIEIPNHPKVASSHAAPVSAVPAISSVPPISITSTGSPAFPAPSASDGMPAFSTGRASPASITTDTKAIEETHLIQKPASFALANNAFVSHELNGMMFGLTGVIETISDSQKDMRTVVDEMPNSVYKTKLLSMLTSLESWTRCAETSIRYGASYTEGNFSVQKLVASEMTLSEFDPQSLLRDVINLYSPEAGKKEIKIKYTPLDERFSIKIDKTRLQQILNGLIVNAIKYTALKKTHTSPPEISVAFKYKVEAETTKLIFEVSDTGMGMSAEKIKGLFKLPSQIEPQISPKYGSNGIGLCCSKKIAEQLGGEISCQSTEGVGSTFVCVINYNGKPKPIQRCPSPILLPQFTAAVNKMSLHTKVAIDTPKAKRVLLVDDTHVQRQIMKKFFEKDFVENGRYTCELAIDGKEAIEKITQKNQVYDIILTDLTMPGMDGYTLAQNIRAYEKATGSKNPIPIVAMTASCTSDLQEKLAVSGINACFQKPTSKEGHQTMFTVINRFTDGDARATTSIKPSAN